MANDLSPGEMLEEAKRETGLSDWGGPEWGGDFREDYDVFIDALNREAELHESGAVLTRERILRLLSGRLRLVADRKRHPDMAKEVIRKPIFVMGFNRSGTTFTHSVLAADPANRAPAVWEITYPSPPPDTASYPIDPRIDKTNAMLEREGAFDPKIKAVHPQGATRFEECAFIWDYTFIGWTFFYYWNIPSYKKYLLDKADINSAYQFQQSFLQHLQFRCPRDRWVLKCPPHTLYLENIFNFYPDAQFVQCLRDPVKWVASTATAAAAHRTIYTYAPFPADWGQQELVLWSMIGRKAAEFRDTHPELENRFFDLQFVEMQRDPIGNLKRAYRQFGIPLTAHRLAAIEKWLQDDRSEWSANLQTNKLGEANTRTTYFENTGLTRQQVEQSLGFYRDRFKILVE